jgi:hypothetical protein
MTLTKHDLELIGVYMTDEEYQTFARQLDDIQAELDWENLDE